MKAYVLINIRTGEIREVLGQMKKIKEVKEVNMTFGPYDAVAVVESDDIDHLGKIVVGMMHPIPGVEDTWTCLTVEL